MNRDTFGAAGKAIPSRTKHVRISVEGVGASEPALPPQDGGDEIGGSERLDTSVHLEQNARSKKRGLLARKAEQASAKPLFTAQMLQNQQLIQ